MTNLSVFNQNTANELFNSTEQFPIKFDDAWQWLQYSTKGNAKDAFFKCGFSESIDFIVFLENHKNLDSALGGRPSKQASLTIDCFKSWAMMSKTATGKQVRLYFLECERIAKEVKPRELPFDLNDSVSVLKYALVEAEKAKAAELALEAAKPAVDLVEQMEVTGACIDMTSFAQVIGKGRNKLFAQLREMKILKPSGWGYNTPYQQYIDSEYFEVQEVAYNLGISMCTRVTPKGQKYLVQRLKEANFID